MTDILQALIQHLKDDGYYCCYDSAIQPYPSRLSVARTINGFYAVVAEIELWADEAIVGYGEHDIAHVQFTDPDFLDKIKHFCEVFA